MRRRVEADGAALQHIVAALLMMVLLMMVVLVMMALVLVLVVVLEVLVLEALVIVMVGGVVRVERFLGVDERVEHVEHHLRRVLNARCRCRRGGGAQESDVLAVGRRCRRLPGSPRARRFEVVP